MIAMRETGRRVSAVAVLWVAARMRAGLVTGDDLASWHSADRDLARMWVQVLEWAVAAGEVDGAALSAEALVAARVSTGVTLSQMQALSQAYILRRATAPEQCGPAIAVAPARGAAVVFTPREKRWDGERWVSEAVGYRGRDALRVADAFDKMTRAAMVRGAEGPFSPAQISVGRAYAGMVEFVEAGAVRVSSLAGGGGGGDGGVDFIERYSDARRSVMRMQAAIGVGAAMAVRRVRPSKRSAEGSARARTISDRALVDRFCLGGESLRDILLAHGWASSGQNIEILRLALGGALERMR